MLNPVFFTAQRAIPLRSEGPRPVSDQPDNLVLELLRAIRGDIAGLRDDMADMRRRLTTLEIQVTNLASTEGSHYANTALRLDRLGDDVDRIKRRLDIVPVS